MVRSGFFQPAPARLNRLNALRRPGERALSFGQVDGRALLGNTFLGEKNSPMGAKSYSLPTIVLPDPSPTSSAVLPFSEGPSVSLLLFL